MTNLSVSEKIALEEVFLVLNEKKVRKLELLKKYILFYKSIKMFNINKRRLLVLRK